MYKTKKGRILGVDALVTRVNARIAPSILAFNAELLTSSALNARLQAELGCAVYVTGRTVQPMIWIARRYPSAPIGFYAIEYNATIAYAIVMYLENN